MQGLRIIHSLPFSSHTTALRRANSPAASACLLGCWRPPRRCLKARHTHSSAQLAWCVRALANTTVHIHLKPWESCSPTVAPAQRRQVRSPGQCIRYRSSCSTPSRSIVPSNAFRTASVPWASSGFSLEVKNTLGFPAEQQQRWHRSLSLTAVSEL